ncbi:hypothetical protein [Pandoraea commovens]|uniref:Uncharacterized protein n=1 Tax=Pandoraea commovens TaxID=2508289 RepID=A0ABY5Q8N1_9BURK|nr:hypothetical protein [Pandoraea commovens]UVA77126.1 hypothetical protein NTU39_00280 [Pandoraea commovens]
MFYLKFAVVIALLWFVDDGWDITFKGTSLGFTQISSSEKTPVYDAALDVSDVHIWTNKGLQASGQVITKDKQILNCSYRVDARVANGTMQTSLSHERCSIPPTWVTWVGVVIRFSILIFCFILLMTELREVLNDMREKRLKRYSVSGRGKA